MDLWEQVMARHDAGGSAADVKYLKEYRASMSPPRARSLSPKRSTTHENEVSLAIHINLKPYRLE